MLQDSWYIHIEKNEVGTPTPGQKINSEWIIDLNVGDGTINLLEENTGIDFCDLGLGSHLLDFTPEVQAATAKLKTGFHQN